MRILLLPLLVVVTLGCSDPAAVPGADAGPADATPDAPVPLAPGVTPRPAGAVRLATFNVRRLFDATCDSGSCAAGDFEELPTAAAFAAHVDQIAVAILSLDATAVALQEIENQAALDALQARLAPWLPHGVLGETGAPGSMDVAVVAALPILEVRRHRQELLTRPDGTTTYFSRELLEVHLDAGGGRVVLVSAHFRSQYQDDPGRRLAEAQAAARIVTATGVELPTALVVLAGDLNDWAGSPPIDALEASGDLVRVEAELPAAEQVTVYDSYGALAIDHLMQDVHAGGAYVAGSVRIVRATAGAGLGGSDHAAVLADFTLPPP
ncbi:MAG TPA: endonuclease/exonuclease/phosphatase family protein [Polyangia bacterium]|jgi:endonuclease/exonuclease/phosphatase family metal-dependent hydrolase